MSIYVRVNGCGHAFSRELGCKCGRCTTVNYSMDEPTGKLEEFPGWSNPPWRAHTSASILLSDDENYVKRHVLIDIGSGVVDSLVSSKIQGLENLDALLITHGHPDHYMGLNQLCESIKRQKGKEFTKIPLYCSMATYGYVAQRFPYEVQTFFRPEPVRPDEPFIIGSNPQIEVLPIHVAHGFAGDMAFIYVVTVKDKKIVFGWDINVPDAPREDGQTNRQIFASHQTNFQNTDLLFMEANTWQTTQDTGHTSYLAAQDYIDMVKTQNKTKVYLVHMSGHEDTGLGYGWDDDKWEQEVKQDKYTEQIEPQGVTLQIAKQGLLLQL